MIYSQSALKYLQYYCLARTVSACQRILRGDPGSLGVLCYLDYQICSYNRGDGRRGKKRFIDRTRVSFGLDHVLPYSSAI